eukprot:623908-Alexandrium_andersonii.AAC.1
MCIRDRCAVVHRKPGLPLALGRKSGLTYELPPLSQVLCRTCRLEVVDIDNKEQAQFLVSEA